MFGLGRLKRGLRAWKLWKAADKAMEKNGWYDMEDKKSVLGDKPVYKSRTVWGTIVSVAGLIGTIAAVQQGEISLEVAIPAMVAAIGLILKDLGLRAAVGRAIAGKE